MAARDLPVAQGQTRPGLSMRARGGDGWLWASPWILGFLIFTLGPMLASFYFSFTRYSITNTPVFIGLDNFTRALGGKDPLFWPSMGLTRGGPSSWCRSASACRCWRRCCSTRG